MLYHFREMKHQQNNLTPPRMTVVATFWIVYMILPKRNTTSVTSGTGTAYTSEAPEFTPGFWWGSCYSIFSFICMFCRSLFVLLYYFFWPLYCLFFFDIRILITPLVSSISSYNKKHKCVLLIFIKSFLPFFLNKIN